MAFLYVNSRGNPWKKHSFSAGVDFDHCPLKYFLRRVLGWKERENKARFLFGRALEDAIQFHHDHNGQGGVQAFVRNWEPYEKQTDIVYTKTERDWASLNKAGQEMIKLYIARQPYLPIPLGANVTFQREFAKEVFPGDETYGGIEDAGKLDIISYVKADHPLLPKSDYSADKLRPVLIDIKTSGMDFPDIPGLAGHDNQLRRYSWLSGIRTVALLWFKKAGHTFKRGSSISFLEIAGPYIAGQEAVVANVEGDGDLWIVKDDFMLDVMDDAQGKKEDGKVEQTNVAKERRRKWLEKFAIKVPEGIVTRQRLQFNAGVVSKESADDAGLQAASQIVRIVNAWNTKKWPNTFGIRFPHDDRGDAYFRAFVLDDKTYRSENFIKTDEETLNDLFAEEEENHEA